MNFDPPLKPAVLIKRYKRFLADVTLANGETTTLHVANTGAMTGCANEGDMVWYSTSNNPKRKLPLSWELTQKANNDFICVNTLRANQLVEEAIVNGTVKEFAGFKTLQKEIAYGSEKSRIDFLLTSQNGEPVYIEVKSVTLFTEHNGQTQGYFPDAVTTRGQKHLRELTEIVKQGQRAVLFFAVLHTGITSVKVAAHIDPTYAKLLTEAQQAGVEIFVYCAEIKQNSIKLVKTLPFLAPN